MTLCRHGSFAWLPISFAALALGIPACGSDYVPPDVCSSGSVAPDYGESPLMRPGGDCVACHSTNGGPHFAIAGTVMSGSDDDDNCNGVAGVTVELTDANQHVTNLVTNQAGSFYLQGGAIALPYKVRLLYQGRTRDMVAAQAAGSCNSCHTADGASGAPGRILAP